MELTLMKGNEAIAEAAVRAGCRFFFGYPITPQTEIPEYMSARMPEVSGCYLQAESEVSAINMVFGAAGTGARVMTSSSSPGISLKQEGISYIAGAELPCLVVNVMRGGPGLGGIQASQGDYFQATKGGGHGDYRLIVLAPASVQEAVDLIGSAFDLADKYRMPVMILADGIIGQMMEPVVLPEMREYTPADKSWAATGYDPEGDKPRAVINSLYIEIDELSVLHERLQSRYKLIAENETRFESYNMDKAELFVVAYGTVARICKAAIDELGEQGINIGLIRPISLWPFPTEEIRKAAENPDIKGVLTVELSTGQMVEDVRLAVGGIKPVDFLGHGGSLMPTADEVRMRLLELKEGK